MNDDQKLEADQLPSGFVPLWFDIKKKGEMSQREILEKISELEEIAGLSVTVLYDDRYNEDSSAKQFCDEIKWSGSYRVWPIMTLYLFMIYLLLRSSRAM